MNCASATICQFSSTLINRKARISLAQPSPHFFYSEINALPLNGQQAVTAINALWLRRSTAFRWLQQPIGRHLMIDVVEQVIEKHPKVKNEGIPECPVKSWRTLAIAKSVSVLFWLQP